MVGTIGSLVQETEQRFRWLGAGSIYIVACTASAAAFGATLSLAGDGIGNGARGGPGADLVTSATVGTIAILYGASDLGFIWMPRPRLSYAVPRTWWLRWHPYGAALAYGAALGLGITTRISFGAFYVLALCCLVSHNTLYSAFILGVYGAARSFILFPASWAVYRMGAGFGMLGNRADLARVTLAAAAIGFGVLTWVALLL